uniref:NADH-ubiquinone oxidoreductase chain 5 n=1 Tax=Dinoderus minutus TaxID=1587246 RepID=A0A343C1B9_9COLE|nr:NADH dehydrogenase subunit 5 [Dinoderus minutus]
MSLFFFSFSLLFMLLDYSLILELNLFSLNSSHVVYSILFDWMSLLFMSFVLFISSMVVFYSGDYMLGDLFMSRFILLVVLFVFSMMMLIISPNLISILLGWDGLGLVSYCLVVYYQNEKSFNAGMLTALTNRIGDVALLMSISWMLNFGSWNFVYYIYFSSYDYLMNLIVFFVILAAFTKSAQIPFSSWLPAAMAAPTPVSSLVHSSTLVTAGVYLLIRFSYSIPMEFKMVSSFLSLMTMFMAGLGANYEYDLKKIIALSTLSQLGLMMSILFLGSSILSFFHLLTHALFKALLFMCAGNFIHLSGNFQDIRYMGSYLICMPLTCLFFNISNFSLCGLPFLSGFYSKDLLLEVYLLGSFNLFAYFIMFVSTGLTMMYTVRLMYYTLYGSYNYITMSMICEVYSKMMSGMSGLIFLVIMGGSLLNWIILPVPFFICLPFLFKISALLFTLLGGFLGFEISQLSISAFLYSLFYPSLTFFFSCMWFMPLISTYLVSNFPLRLGHTYLKIFDQGWFEHLGSQGLFNNVKFSSSFLNLLLSNNLKIFLIFLVGSLVLVFFL